jgi:hypothetical protein
MVTMMQGQNLTPEQAAAQAAAIQKAQNRNFMALSMNKEVLCQQANGGATSQAFASGQALTWNVSTANNAFLTGFWVQCAFTVALAAGTGTPVYTLNAGAPMTLIDSIQVLYGGTQFNFRPYILKYLAQLMGANKQVQPRAVVAGQVDSYLQSYYNSAPYGTAVGNNTWNFSFYVPMNLIHPQDVRGILPIQYGETTCEVIVNCAGAPYGTDPILNTVTSTGGSGSQTATVTGNIKIIATYKDGQAFSQLTALQPNLAGIETVQFLRDTPLNNVSTGQVFRNKVSYLNKIPWLLVTVVDGVASNKFCSTSNIVIIDTTADQAGNRPFWRYGQGTNLDVRAFYDDLSGQFGGLLQQDLDEGILPIIYGPIFQQSDPGLMEGQAYLNCTQSDGWTDFHYGVQLNAVGSVASPGPRLESHVIMLNSPLVM